MSETSEMGPENTKVGFFQGALLFLLGINYIIVGMNHTLPTFHNYEPKFYCKVKGLKNHTTGCANSTDAPTNSSTPFDIGSSVAASNCPAGYRYINENDVEVTNIVTEWGLICERKYLVTISTTLYFTGVIVGAWISGILADRVGRLPVIAVCLYTQGTLTVALYIIQDFRVFLAVRALQGLFVQGLQSATYTLLVELYPAWTRTLVGIALEGFWALGLALLAGLSYAIPGWRILQLAISVPTAVTVLYIWVIPESPRWLLARGKLTEADIVLETISKYNNFCCANSEVVQNSETTVPEFVTPEKPKRKSRASNGDLLLKSEKGADGPEIEECAKLLTTLVENERSDKRKSLPEVSENSQSEKNSISDSQMKIETEEDSENREKTRERISASSGNRELNADSESDENREVLRENMDEIVDLRPKEKSPKNEKKSARREERKGGRGDLEQSGKKNKQTFWELLRYKNNRKNCFIMISIWFSVCISYYGIMFYTPILSGDRHLNFAIGAFLEIVSYTVSYFILRKYGRRVPLSIFLLFSGILYIVLAILDQLGTEHLYWTAPSVTILGLLGKAAVVTCFAIIFLYTVEIFPTVLRGAGLGYCAIAGRIGSTAAPGFLLMGDYTSPMMPVTVMGVMCIITGFCALALPETLNEPLPDTIEEAENLGRKKKESKSRGSNRRNTMAEEQREQDILRKELFSDKNGAKTWVDAGNGILVKFSDKNDSE